MKFNLRKYILISSIIILIMITTIYIVSRSENKKIPENGKELPINNGSKEGRIITQKQNEILNGTLNGTLTILAFDNDGNQLNYSSFKLYNTLLISTIDDNYVEGRPWLKDNDNIPIIEWTNATAPIKISIGWELPTTGYSTIYLDNEGQGYKSSQVINFNFEALKTQWKIFNEYYEQRKNSKLSYTPSSQFLELYDQTKAIVKQAESSQIESQKAVYSNQGLDKIVDTWELMLREYGIQYGKKYYDPNNQNRDINADINADINTNINTNINTFTNINTNINTDIFGITIEDLTDYKQKLDIAKSQGNDYIRIVFDEKNDFKFENENSFNIYDGAIDYANSIGLKVMGEVLDSEIWPKDITVDEYRQRTQNLVNHYKGKIFVWEVGNEVNGNWIGGDDDPIADSQVVDCINTAAEEIKTIDPNLNTVVTLYWGEGTFKDDSHPLFIWINKWEKSKNFGNNIDVIGLSLYPQYDPVGSSFDITINKLHEKFPDKKLMIGEFGYLNEDNSDSQSDSQPYWLHSKDFVDIQKFLINQYYTSMMGYEYSINGGFWWNFSDMINNQQLYDTYRNVIYTFKK